MFLQGQRSLCSCRRRCPVWLRGSESVLGTVCVQEGGDLVCGTAGSICKKKTIVLSCPVDSCRVPRHRRARQPGDDATGTVLDLITGIFTDPEP